MDNPKGSVGRRRRAGGCAPYPSAELRDQFAGLKGLIDAKVYTADLPAVIEADSAGSSAGVNYLSLIVSNPPTHAHAHAIADKIDELITALRRV